MTIRNALPEDEDQLIGLLRILTGLEESFSFDEAAHRKGLAALIADQPNACVAVADENGIIAGMCTGQTVISTATGGPSVWVEDVVVLPQFRRTGLGSRLLGHLDEWAESRGARREQLLIDNDNGRALEFYRAQGWQATNFSCLRKML